MTGGNFSRAKGYRFEQKVKHLLSSEGFFCVRQGKSTFPDLVAINKKTKGYVPEKPLEARWLSEGASPR